MIVHYINLPEDKFLGAYIYNEGNEIALIPSSLKGTEKETEIISAIENGEIELIYTE